MALYDSFYSLHHVILHEPHPYTPEVPLRQGSWEPDLGLWNSRHQLYAIPWIRRDCGTAQRGHIVPHHSKCLPRWFHNTFWRMESLPEDTEWTWVWTSQVAVWMAATETFTTGTSRSSCTMKETFSWILLSIFHFFIVFRAFFLFFWLTFFY